MTIFACHKVPCKGGHRAEIPQLFKYTPLFQPFIILALYLQHMESLTEIMRRQAISAPTPPIINFFLLFCSVQMYVSVQYQGMIPITHSSLNGHYLFTMPISFKKLESTVNPM